MGGFLTGLPALGADDVWAVGGAAGSTTARTLTEHWNGSGRTVVSSPPANADAELLGASPGRGGPLLAVGFQNDADGHERTLALRR